MVPAVPPLLETLYFYWEIFLFSAALVVNTVALLVLLKTAGTCFRDPSVTPLFFVIGINILHLLLVNLFDIHSHGKGSFAFSPKLCRILRKNDHILSDIPFPTIGLQLASTLQAMKKDKYGYYTWFSLCFGRLAIILLPTILAITINTTTSASSSTVNPEKCEEAEPTDLDILLRHSLILGLPLLFVLVVLVTFLPYLWRNRGKEASPSVVELSGVSHENLENPEAESRGQIITSPKLKENFGLVDNQPDPCHPDKGTSRDLSLLIVLLVILSLCRAPRLVLHFNQETVHHDSGGVVVLMEKIIWSLPLLLLPLGIISIRRSSVDRCCCCCPKSHTGSEDAVDMLCELHSRHSTEETVQLIVGKELEAAIFKSKTTTL